MSQNDDEILAHYGEEFTRYLIEADGNTLAHFGVKGMKWGRRNSESKERVARQAKEDAANPEVTITRATGKKVSAKGGGNLPAHTDAVEAKVVQQKIDNSGVKAVSNKELKAYLERVRLEQEYSKLGIKQTSQGKQFADAALRKGGKATENVITNVASQYLTQFIKSGVDSYIKG